MGIGQAAGGRAGARRGLPARTTPACGSSRPRPTWRAQGRRHRAASRCQSGGPRSWEGTGASPPSGVQVPARLPPSAAHGDPDADRCEDALAARAHRHQHRKGCVPPERESLRAWSQGLWSGVTRSRKANLGRANAKRSGAGGAGPVLVQPRPGQRRAHPAACVTPSHRRWQVQGSGLMFIGRMSAGSYVRGLRSEQGLKVRPHRYACMYLAPTRELQGATAIAWRVLLEMEVHAEVRRRVRRSGWLLLCQLIQGSCAGSGVGWSGGRQLGRMARRLALMLAPLRIFCLCLGVVSHRGCQYKRAL